MVYTQENQFQRPNLLTEEEVSELEALHSEGTTSADIVNAFSSRGIRFSEATLRKYVQQGLLARSQRVGQKGKHKGSRGIYPVSTIRQINEIKRLMSMDYTIEEIQTQFAFIDGDLEELKALLERIVGKLDKSSKAVAGEVLVTQAVSRQLVEATDGAGTLIGQLKQAAKQIRDRALIARNAV